ncbi:MAG TPA: SUMF1/EgtB/PvdO family nonheme iron enzyme, partial [Aggregatilineales bacterium]|nr:SUMF1/EgtB/PvdO family nonheme iron enzyme [Aggregatilineales bacterium]
MIPPKPKIVLSEPFDWCYIPAGDVLLTRDGHDKDIYIKHDVSVSLSAFWMAKYPITNQQYRQFIDDNGYQTDEWWTSAGVAWRGHNRQPYHWGDEKWSGDDYPVVGVSWYEAVAFCRWLSAKSGENIMLPTDAMRPRAAQGD